MLLRLKIWSVFGIVDFIDFWMIKSYRVINMDTMCWIPIATKSNASQVEHVIEAMCFTNWLQLAETTTNAYIVVLGWWWLVVWIPRIPLWKRLLLRGIPIRIPNHRASNQQLTIIPPGKQMAQLPCIGLSSLLTNRHPLGIAPSTFQLV